MDGAAFLGAEPFLAPGVGLLFLRVLTMMAEKKSNGESAGLKFVRRSKTGKERRMMEEILEYADVWILCNQRHDRFYLEAGWAGGICLVRESGSQWADGWCHDFNHYWLGV